MAVKKALVTPLDRNSIPVEEKEGRGEEVQVSKVREKNGIEGGFQIGLYGQKKAERIERKRSVWGGREKI